ncbi:MAG: DNA polymerase III subunit delta' [Aestuariivirga sp.]
MAEEIGDPRDVTWHPRRRSVLYGHDAAEARLLNAHRSGMLHHAWLISGPRGIGKATLAYRFARFLLQHPKPGEAVLQSLLVPADSTIVRHVAAGAHPDLFVLQRAFDGKKLKSEIAVADARKASEFLERTAGAGGWRIAIVDSADDLNTESANALLKIVEEPPPRSVFLLVSHRPGALAATLRSRCIGLALKALSHNDTLRVLQELPREAVAGDPRQAAELSRGSPGLALDLIGSRGAEVFADFTARPLLTPARCVEIGAHFAGRETAEDYAVFCELLIGWIGGKARQAALSGRGAALAKAHDDIASSLRQTDALNLDRRQTAVDALLVLGEALNA